MDDLLIYGLVILAFYLFRKFAAKQQASGKQGQPGTEQPPDGVPLEGAIPVRQQNQPQPELNEALEELKRAVGFSPPREPQRAPQRPPQRDPEAFGVSEEQFENESLPRDSSWHSEEEFEKRQQYYVPEGDAEDAFERKQAFGKKDVFYDDAFEKKPRSSEVDFSERWADHTSDFEYHSTLDRHPEKTSAPEAITVTPKSAEFTFVDKLEGLTPLQRAVVLHEIVGPPVSLRPRSGRRRPF